MTLFSQALVSSLFRYRSLIIGVWLLLLIVALVGISQLRFVNDYRIFFSDDNPELQTFKAMQDAYGQSDSIIVVLHNRAGSVLQPDIVEGISNFVLQAAELDYVQRVEAITNAPSVTVEDDELMVNGFLQEAEYWDETAFLEKQQQAIDDQSYQGYLLSESTDTTAIHIIYQLPQQDSQAVLQAAKDIRFLVDELALSQPDLQTGISGIVMLNATFSETGIHDAIALLPVMLITLVVVMLLVLRSFKATLMIFLLISLSATFAMGTAGFMGIPLTVVSIASLIIIMTLAVANSMHLLTTMLSLNQREADKKPCERIVDSVSLNIVAISLTSLTTIVSFLTLNFSDAPPYWHLGNITAIGVFYAWLLTFFLLPLLMPVLATSSKAGERVVNHQQLLIKLVVWIRTCSVSILCIAVLGSCLLLSALPKLAFNDQFVDYFDDDILFRKDSDFMQDHLGGLYSLEFMVMAGSGQDIFTAEYRDRLIAFKAWLMQQPEVNHVYSYTDLLDQIDRYMGGDDGVIEDDETAAQYYLLYEMALNSDFDQESRVVLDKSSSRLTAVIDNLSSQQIQALVKRVDSWQSMHFPAYMVAEATGPAVMFANISKRNIEGMMVGNVIALLLITLLLLALLRSYLLGVISLFANAMPILLMFSIWALTVGEMGMVGSTIAAATLGIVVDDSIHFLSKYLYAKRQLLLNTTQAIEYTFKQVGVAIISTTLVLNVGLSVLMFSDFLLNQQTGVMAVMTISLALLFDFLVLPAALLIFDKKPITGNCGKYSS